MDFTAPTPEMVAEAAKQGIDLEDPMVLEALRRVQRRSRRGSVHAPQERRARCTP